MSRCRPGDLAVLVKASCSENVGLIVDVIELAYRSADDGPVWFCRAAGGRDVSCVPLLGGRGPVVKLRKFGVLDAWLRPIRPQPDDAIDEISHKAPEGCEVLTEAV